MDIRITGGHEFYALSRRLQEAGLGGLERELKRAVEKQAQPIADDQRGAVKVLPTKGRKHTGLRSRVAGAVRVQVGTAGAEIGIRIVVDSSESLGKLPAYLNVGSWRHPVFGNRKKWETQTVPPGWFDRPALASYPKVREGIIGAMNDVANKIA